MENISQSQKIQNKIAKIKYKSHKSYQHPRNRRKLLQSDKGHL